MRKIAHTIKLDQVVNIEDHEGLTLRVLYLYIDEFGTESGALAMYPNGKIVSFDSDIWDEYQDGDVTWPYVPKVHLRDDKLNTLFDEE